MILFVDIDICFFVMTVLAVLYVVLPFHDPVLTQMLEDSSWLIPPLRGQTTHASGLLSSHFLCALRNEATWWLTKLSSARDCTPWHTFIDINDLICVSSLLHDHWHIWLNTKDIDVYQDNTRYIVRGVTLFHRSHWWVKFILWVSFFFRYISYMMYLPVVLIYIFNHIRIYNRNQYPLLYLYAMCF